MEHPDFPKIMLLEDGYVRLCLPTLQDLPLIHLVSELDEEIHATPIPQGATLAAICGYTEWVSTTVPVISIGWDWRLNTASMPPGLVRTVEPRSNVMLRDAQGFDIGPAKTAILLESVVDALAWRDVVHEVIHSRYS